MKERRKKTRYNAMFPCVTTSGDSTTKGFIVNISQGGVGIESSLAPEVGAEVTVSFSDHWDKEIRFSGQVIHRNTNLPHGAGDVHGFGVELVAVHSGKEALNELLISLGEGEPESGQEPASTTRKLSDTT